MISILFVLGSLAFIAGTLTKTPHAWFLGAVLLYCASLGLVIADFADWRAWAFLGGSVAFGAGAWGYT